MLFVSRMMDYMMEALYKNHSQCEVRYSVVFPGVKDLLDVYRFVEECLIGLKLNR